MDLKIKKCVPCEGNVPPLSPIEIQNLLNELSNAWEVRDNRKISFEFRFPDFKQTMGFVMKVALLAEAEGHHPDLSVSWGKVTIELWTHAIDGLSENDFILAAKIEHL